MIKPYLVFLLKLFFRKKSLWESRGQSPLVAVRRRRNPLPPVKVNTYPAIFTKAHTTLDRRPFKRRHHHSQHLRQRTLRALRYLAKRPESLRRPGAVEVIALLPALLPDAEPAPLQKPHRLCDVTGICPIQTVGDPSFLPAPAQFPNTCFAMSTVSLASLA